VVAISSMKYRWPRKKMTQHGHGGDDAGGEDGLPLAPATLPELVEDDLTKVTMRTGLVRGRAILQSCDPDRDDGRGRRQGSSVRRQ
jgi:hypothetical protein